MGDRNVGDCQRRPQDHAGVQGPQLRIAPANTGTGRDLTAGMSIAWAEVAGERLEVLRISSSVIARASCSCTRDSDPWPAGVISRARYAICLARQGSSIRAAVVAVRRRSDGRAAPTTCIARRGRCCRRCSTISRSQRPCWSVTATAARSRCYTRRVTSRVRLPSWRRTCSSKRSRSKVFATPARPGRAASCKRHSRDCTTIPTARSSAGTMAGSIRPSVAGTSRRSCRRSVARSWRSRVSTTSTRRWHSSTESLRGCAHPVDC